MPGPNARVYTLHTPVMENLGCYIYELIGLVVGSTVNLAKYGRQVSDDCIKHQVGKVGA